MTRLERASHPRPRLRLLGIDPAEASFERRGFSAATRADRERLELVGRTFVAGYRAALADDDETALERALASVDLELRGFAYEGAAMALSVLDTLQPWRRDRFASFVTGAARPHVYMAHVGAGWALARLRRGPRATRRLDGLLRWLALDGYGFHQGYFHPARHLDGHAAPRRLRGYALRAFDQGLGRSLWFARGTDVPLAAATVAGFPAERRSDLWSGLGLAAAYAGPLHRERALALRAAAGRATVHVAQGAAFAAAARERAGNPAVHTELGCRLLAGVSAAAAAKLSDAAADALPPDGEVPAYELWRARLRRVLARTAALSEAHA